MPVGLNLNKKPAFKPVLENFEEETEGSFIAYRKRSSTASFSWVRQGNSKDWIRNRI